MSHIFISYSRSDIAFAGKIVQSLADNKLDTWIDWKSIPKGEDWEQEIYRGIEEADAFLFLISPDSVASVMCNKEIAHAVENGKRILPIVIRDANPDNIHPEISKRNWIFCRDGRDDFNKAIEETRETIHTNYEWLKFHTELQVKALKWEKKKDNSRLLRGKELREAELQVTEISSQEDPQPTKLQREYILFSQRNEVRTRRQITIGLTIGFVVTSFLCMAALVSSVVAVVQRNEARRQAKIALAHQLSAQSLLAMERQDYQVATLLAIESGRSYQNDDAQNILSKMPYVISAYKQPEEKTFFENSLKEIPIQSNQTIAWSTDNRLAVTDLFGNIHIVDFSNPETQLTLNNDSQPGLSLSLSWSPDGRLASGSFQGTITIWNVEKKTPDIILKSDSTGASYLCWLGNEKIVAAFSNGIITTWDVNSGQIISSITSDSSDENGFLSNSMQLSKKGNLMAWGAFDGVIRIWDLSSSKALPPLRISNSSGLSSFAWTSDDKLIAGYGDGQIVVWDLESGNPVQFLSAHKNSVTAMSLINDKLLASGSSDNIVVIWNLDTGKSTLILHGDSSGFIDVSWSSENRLAARTAYGTVLVWDLSNTQTVQTLSGHSDGVQIIAMSPDGKLGSASKNGELIIWSNDYQKHQLLLSTGHPIHALIWSPQGELISGAYDGTILFWNLTTGQSQQRLFGYSNSIEDFSWSQNDYLAIASIDGTVDIWDMKNYELVNHIKTLSLLLGDQVLGGFFSVAWSNNDWLAAGHYDGTVYLLKTGEDGAAQLLGHKSTVIDADWSFDNKLATADVDGTIIIWDLAQMKPGRVLNFNSGNSLLSIKWAADGRLVSGYSDGKMAIWEILKDQPEQVLQGPDYSINSILWLEDGTLLSASNDKTIKILPEIFTHSPCSWSSRNLTTSEWRQYFGDSAYHATCPNLPIPTE